MRVFVLLFYFEKLSAKWLQYPHVPTMLKKKKERGNTGLLHAACKIILEQFETEQVDSVRESVKSKLVF